jgi:exopolysaccharide biosynthesis polyprenyl glycosylphosphotransferase
VSSRLRLTLAFLTVAVDSAATAVAFFLSYRLREAIPFPTPLRLGPFRDYLGLLVLYVVSMVLVFFLYRLYHPRRGQSRVDLFYSLLSAVSIGVIVSTSLSYLVTQGEALLTRGAIIYSLFFTIALVGLGRALMGRVECALRTRHPEHLLLVGTGEVARMILQKTVQSPQLGYRVIGFVDGQSDLQEVAGLPVFGGRAQLAEIVAQHGVGEVIIALPEASHDELLDMIQACETAHAAVRIFPDLFQIIASELSIGDLDGLPMLTVRDAALRGWKLTVKRAMDVVLSGLGLMVLSPFLLLVALAIKLESKGPVFFTQVRVGLDGKPFEMVKFRSMRVDAEAQTGAVWATEDDPRRTRLGTILRKTSIDELPQLINVLLGDMSLVGPRPERPVFVDQFRQVVPRYMERHQEKAGMTGWAQVNGLRGDTSIIERTKYDLYYIENWSLLFDLKILVRTFVNALKGDRHAY